MGLKLITPPAEFCVTLAEAKRHCNVDVADYDSLLAIYIGAASNSAEVWLGRALIDQTFELTLDEFPPNELRIPRPPLIEVLSVTYDDAAGDAIVLDPAEYTVDLATNNEGWILPNGSWPGTFDGINAVRIRYRAGYLNQDSPPAQNVPDDIRHAVLLAIRDAFDERGTISVGLSIFTAKTWDNLLARHWVDRGLA